MQLQKAVAEFAYQGFEQIDMFGLAFIDDDLPHFAVVEHMADVVVGGQQGLLGLVEFGIDLNGLRVGAFVRQDAEVGIKAQPREAEGLLA